MDCSTPFGANRSAHLRHCESFSWVGIFVTGKTPPDVVQKRSTEITKILDDSPLIGRPVRGGKRESGYKRAR